MNTIILSREVAELILNTLDSLDVRGLENQRKVLGIASVIESALKESVNGKS